MTEKGLEEPVFRFVGEQSSVICCVPVKDISASWDLRLRRISLRDGGTRWLSFLLPVLFVLYVLSLAV